MRKIALFCAMMLCMYAASAQNTIKGKITDISTNNPLYGATISVNGKNLATTDKTGNFSFSCSGAVTITFSYIGYETQKIKANCGDELTIQLRSGEKTLDNVEIETSSQNKNILHQPASITKLSTLELKRGQGVFLDDAIQTSVPGVIMNRRTVSGGQQFNIRGYGNGSRGTRGISSNFDGQGYKAYLNGVPVTDAEGITTLDDIDYGALGSVEILKGPAGTLYGQAISGAINFRVLPAEKGKTSLEQQTMFGNYGLQRYTTLLRAGGDRSGVLLAYGKQKSDGFSIHNASHKDFVNFVGEVTPNDRQSISTFVGYSDSYDQRLGELTLQQWANNDFSGNIEYIKRDAHSHVSTFRAGLSHRYMICDNVSNTTTLFGAGFRSDVSSAGGWTDKTTVNYGFRTSFETKFNAGSMASLNGITGMEIQRQDGQIVGYNMKQNPKDTTTNGWSWGKPYWVVNAQTSNAAFVTQPTSFFTEWTLGLPKDLSITAGIGFSTQRIKLDDRFTAATATYPAHFDTSYKKMVSPHLAINKVFSKGISVYASYSTGFKAPVSSYFYIPQTGKVNNVLKPEKGEQIEIGTKGSVLADKLIYEIAFFSLDFKDKMTAVAVPNPANTATAYSYMVNGRKQEHKGIEALVRYSIIKNTRSVAYVTPFVNLTYSDFTYGDNFIYKTGTTITPPASNNIDTINYSGLNVFGVPKMMAAFGIDAALKNGLYASISDLYKGPVNIALERVTQNPETFALRTSDSYNLLNAKIGYRRSLSSHFDMDVFFGANNITGEKYPIMIFVNQLPDAYIPAAPKAVVFGGLNLKYNFGK